MKHVYFSCKFIFSLKFGDGFFSNRNTIPPKKPTTSPQTTVHKIYIVNGVVNSCSDLDRQKNVAG